MPYPPHIKATAYKLDPDCWVSYSGCEAEHKRKLDVRRKAALDRAVEAARAMFDKISKKVKMDENFAPVREAIRSVFKHSRLGKSDAYTILRTVSGGRAKKVSDLRGDELTRAVSLCESVIVYADRSAALAKLMKSEAPWEKTTMSMPVLKLKMLLHFATSPNGPFVPESVRKSEAYPTYVKELIRDEMIERPTQAQRNAHAGWSYKLTMRGQVFVNALRLTPLPVRTEPEWKMPIK